MDYFEKSEFVKMSFSSSTKHSKSWKKMQGRLPHEEHRVATNLELLFDLIFVVAIAFAAAELHHAINHNHVVHGVVSFLVVFLAIWWAWMGFTWFASSFDTDDTPYRIAVFVQMAGALVIAAGIPDAFEHNNFLIVVAGYTLMRNGSIFQWLRVAFQAPKVRKTALRYALGIFIIQIGWWLSVLVVPAAYWWFAYAILMPLELLVPMWAESAGMTPWHPHHIAERYGLLTIIVLGESILSTANAIKEGLANGLLSANFLLFCLGAFLIVICLWWIYFGYEGHTHPKDYKTAFSWGYGHYFIFASVAATGAGLAVQVDFRLEKAHIDSLLAGYSLALPVAIYVVSIWLIQDHLKHAKGSWILPLSSLAILATPWFTTGYTTICIGLILIITVILHQSFICKSSLARHS